MSGKIIQISTFLTMLLIGMIFAPLLSTVDASSTGQNAPPALVEQWYKYDSKMEIGGFDNLDNMYLSSWVGYSNSYASQFGFSHTGGFTIAKTTPTGTTEWSKHIRTIDSGYTNYCTCEIKSIEVAGPNEFYFIFTINSSEFWLIDPDTNYGFNSELDGDGLKAAIVVYHSAITDRFEWAEVIEINGDVSHSSAVVEHHLDSNNNLIITSRNNYVDATDIGIENHRYTITSLNSTGKQWTKELEISSDIAQDFNLRTDISGTEINYFIQTNGSIDFAGQTVNCPTGSELGICYVWLTLDENGSKIRDLAINNPRVTFTSFAIRNGDAYLGGLTGYTDSTYCPLSCNSTNFTGTPINGTGESRSLVFASLNSSNYNWNYAHHTNMNATFQINDNSHNLRQLTRGLLPNNQNHHYHQNGSTTYMYSCLNNYMNSCDTDLEIDGSNVSSLSGITEAQLTFITIDAQGSYQWHTSIGFNTSNCCNRVPLSDYNVVFSGPNDYAALFLEYGGDWNYGDIVVSNGTSNQVINMSQVSGLLLWVNIANGTIIDWHLSDQGDSTDYKHPLAISPLGRTLTVNSIEWNANPTDSASDNYGDKFHSTGWYFHSFEVDSDIDSVGNSNDNCPNTFNSNQVNYDGDSEGDLCDLDDDNDGVDDVNDLCPRLDSNQGWLSHINYTDPSLTTDWDVDGCQDSTSEDSDDDNDGILDPYDICPLGILGLGNDTDGDGCKDAEDNDDDNDLITDGEDFCPVGELGWLTGKVTDFDSDGCMDDVEDFDDDNDGILDVDDQCTKGELNWKSNLNTDFNGDGCLDSVEDEDNDDDGVYNFADLCQYSNGSVDENGCTSDQLSQLPTDSDNNNTIPSIMYVCEGGTAVVLDIGDCPPVEPGGSDDNSTVNQTNWTQPPSFYYVCPGGQMVVLDFADCPEYEAEAEAEESALNLSELNVDNLTLILSSNSSMPQGFIVCPGGTALVIDEADCPGAQTQDEQDSGVSDDIASGGGDGDNDQTLTYMVGAALILSIIAVLVGLLRSSGGRTPDDIDLMVQSHIVDEAIPEPPIRQNKPPKSSHGTINDGYEWLEWPDNSGQNWYRTPGSNSEWAKWTD